YSECSKPGAVQSILAHYTPTRYLVFLIIGRPLRTKYLQTSLAVLILFLAADGRIWAFLGGEQESCCVEPMRPVSNQLTGQLCVYGGGVGGNWDGSLSIAHRRGSDVQPIVNQL